MDHFQHIIIIGDVNEEFKRTINDGNPLRQSSNPDQLYLKENNIVLTIIIGVDKKIIEEALKFKSPLRIFFVCKTVSVHFFSYLTLIFNKAILNVS